MSVCWSVPTSILCLPFYLLHVGGTLADYIQKRCNSLLDEDMIMHFFVQILLALYHVHNKLILHRDLKTQNILLDKHQMIVKIGDFGISKILVSKSKAYTVSDNRLELTNVELKYALKSMYETESAFCPTTMFNCFYLNGSSSDNNFVDFWFGNVISFTGSGDTMLHLSWALWGQTLQPEEWHLGPGLCALWTGQP